MKSIKFALPGILLMSLCLRATTLSDLAAADSDQSASTPAPNSNVVPSDEGPLARWLTLDAFNFSSRYRSSSGTTGTHYFESGQERSLVSGKVKIDHDGKYFIGFRASSGRYFNWGYSTFAGVNFANVAQNGFSPAALAGIFRAVEEGAGGSVPQSRGWDFYVRELYGSATPVKFLTVEFGGLGIERGVASEITTFDEDGYIAGERVRLNDKNHLYFDQVSVTLGYLGDIDTPNLFARGQRLVQNNYRQIAVNKSFGKRVALSAQYDWLNGFSTVREAARFAIGETRVFDGTRLELYQRTNSAAIERGVFPSGNGWSVSANKNLWKKSWQLEAGYANIDPFYGVNGNLRVATLAGFSLNGDAYQIGQRVFTRASFTPHPFVTLFGFYTHELNPDPYPAYHALNRQNIQAGLTLNFKAMLDRTKLF